MPYYPKPFDWMVMVIFYPQPRLITRMRRPALEAAALVIEFAPYKRIRTTDNEILVMQKVNKWEVVSDYLTLEMQFFTVRHVARLVQVLQEWHLDNTPPEKRYYLQLLLMHLEPAMPMAQPESLAYIATCVAEWLTGNEIELPWRLAKTKLGTHLKEWLLTQAKQ